jgi:hypothetical protein
MLACGAPEAAIAALAKATSPSAPAVPPPALGAAAGTGVERPVALVENPSNIAA